MLDGPRESLELARARELRPLYDRVDYLLDLHSMSEPCPPLAMAGRLAKGLELARALTMREHIVIDAGQSAGRRLRDYAFFDDPTDSRNALLIECGQHWEAAAPRIAKEATLRFLAHFDIVDKDWLGAHLDSMPHPPQRVIEVTTAITIATDNFGFVMPVHGLQVIPRAGTLYAVDGNAHVRTPYDDCVLIMPTRRPKRGETAVRLGRYIA